MKFESIEEKQPLYWEGRSNIFVRLITYAKIGVNQVNDYKYIGAAIFGVYYALKLSNPWWLLLMGLVSLPLLILLGRWWLYRGAKASEFVTTQKGSVLKYDAYNIQVEILEELKRLNNKTLLHKNGSTNDFTCAESGCEACQEGMRRIL